MQLKTKMKIINLLGALIVSGFALCASAAETIYLWYDEDGTPNYDETPPPGVKATKIQGYTGSKGQQSTAEASEEAKQDQGPLTEEQKKLREARRAQCDSERQRIATLKSDGARIRMQAEDGTTRYLTPDEVLKEIQASEQFLAQACK